MYHASSGRFGTIPHVCSYEAVGEHREVVSNILSLPHNEDILKYHWQIFSDHPPKKPEIRTLWFTDFGVEGRSLVEAKSPRQLSRAWVDFVLGVSVVTVWRVIDLMHRSRRVADDIPVWISAEGRQYRKCPHDRAAREEGGVQYP